MVLEVIFWILLILSLIPAFIPDTWPHAARSRYGVLLLLVAILGLKMFGNFLTK
jgi:hypothetical protein